MKFKRALFTTGKMTSVYLDELTVKEAKELLKEHPHLEKFLIDADSSKGSGDDSEAKPKQRRSKRVDSDDNANESE